MFIIVHYTYYSSVMLVSSGAKNQKSSKNRSNRFLYCWSPVYKNLARLTTFTCETADSKELKNLRVWPQMLPPPMDFKLECLLPFPIGASSPAAGGFTTVGW